MGKVDFHSTEKVWENTNIPKLWVSQIFWVTQKSIQFKKNREKVDFHSTEKVRENIKNFKFMGFLNISYNP